MRGSPNTSPSQVNLVSARSQSHARAHRLSRVNSADGYASLRRKRARKKKVLVAASITLASLLVAAVVAVGVYVLVINGKLGTDQQGTQADFGSGAYAGALKEPAAPEDPFWMLLMGTDNREGYEVPRTDTLILAHVDQKNKKAAMISIPRDLYVEIPGHGSDRVNTAYALAEAEEPGTGPALTIKTVQALAGVDISYFAQIDFNGLVGLVDGLGGVEVDVPVDIIGDIDAGGLDIHSGLQTLDGAHALTFCRSRDPFFIGDYQRQANQRTFLQALARKILAADLPTIATMVTNVADMTFTNLDLATLVKVAQGMQGMQENGIHTYFVPSTLPPDDNEGPSYVALDEYAWSQLVTSLDAGEYPEHQDDSLAGVVPEGYLPSTALSTTDRLSGQASTVATGDYVVDVRNGCGTDGCATSVSDMLALAGYRHGEIGNANSFVYDTTLVIYQDDARKAAAEDIRKRLGYGKLISSEGRYTFTGDVLVVVGDDFPVSK
jgi:LCP family protein required for cell wall assembly